MFPFLIEKIMFKFDMCIEHNSASFKSTTSNKYVFVDSFDNHEFDVRMGTISESKKIGSITASTSEELNRKLRQLCSKHKE